VREVASVYELSDRYLGREGRVLLTGVQALARLPIEQLHRDRAAGRDTAAFVSGYPGSPLGGLDREIERARLLAGDLPIVHRPAVNEELAATAVMGSQLASGRLDATVEGVVGVWYGKAPGLDRAGDAMRHGVFAGAHPTGGVVVLVGDDPACKSSTMPSSSDATLVDLHMPILYPGTVAECLELGVHAVALSRACGVWSAMKIVTAVADGSGTVDLPVVDRDPLVPFVEINGKRWVCRPSARFLGARMVDVEREFREVRLPLAERYGIENRLNRVTVDPSDAWIGLVATGFTFYELLDALRRLGLGDERSIAAAGVRLLQLRMPVPFDAALVRRFAAGLDEIVVVEEKNGTLEWLVKDALYGGPHQPRVVGKTDEDGRTLMRSWGPLDADAILPGLRARLARRLEDRLAPLPVVAPARALIPLSVERTPYFCSGCPHNWGIKVPAGALVGAGTGCHGMTLLMDADRVGETIGITAMGNEGAQWVGMAPFVRTDHLFQNEGDGTFFHSGQLALQYCIGAGVNVTFKILYNATVAMTGGQDSVAAVAVPELCTILRAYGVAKVVVTTDDLARYRAVTLPPGVEVRDRVDIVNVQDELRATPGVTVLVHDQRCAAEVRRDRHRGRVVTPTKRVVINPRVCEGCGDCGDVSGCLSVQPVDTPFGRKTAIEQASCNLDYSCVHGDCPAFMTVEPARTTNTTNATNTTNIVDETPGELPSPDVHAFDDPNLVRIRLAGIGGTGVVTAAQILATAAMLDGWEVRGLDQTGLSQKAGPVVSDLVLARPGHGSSNLVGDSQADVMIAFDELVAASDPVVRSARRERTVVVGSSHPTPTGRMITRPDLAYPTEGARARIAARTDLQASRYLDAEQLTIALTGNAATANMLLLGVAVQHGVVPVSPVATERAIKLNGVAVDANMAAFSWGRRYAHDPDDVTRRARTTTSGPPTQLVTVAELPADLARVVAALPTDTDTNATVGLLAADLVGYQHERYAATFLDTVERVAAAEHHVAPGSSRLTQTAARSLHKLMAYKDEYEVARLLLLPEAIAAAEAVGGRRAVVTWHLHPPLLARLGVHHKLKFGPWSRPLLHALLLSKRLRGTPLDPFGRTPLRRTERALPGEYRAALDLVLRSLSADNLEIAIALAQLPDHVRGYESLKRRRVDEYRAQLNDALQQFS